MNWSAIAATSFAAGFASLSLAGPVFSGTTSLVPSYGSIAGELLGSMPTLHFTPLSLGQTPDRFETFCLEKFEAIGQNSVRADLNDRTVANPGNASYQSGLHGGAQDPISDATAWLYSRFITGTLPGYRYAGSFDDRTADADKVQLAIWALEEDQDPPAPGANAFYDAALSAVAGGYVNDGRVHVLNLYVLVNQGGNVVRNDDQDVLVMVPGPAGAVVFGLAGLVGTRRKR